MVTVISASNPASTHTGTRDRAVVWSVAADVVGLEFADAGRPVRVIGCFELRFDICERWPESLAGAPPKVKLY